MGVHRDAPAELAPKTPKPPHRERLGHVRVTIDDLAALVEMLSRGATGQEQLPVSIRHFNGTIDGAADIADLTDRELKRLELRTSEATVVLAIDDAFAIGDERLVSHVRQSWANPRNFSRSVFRDSKRFAITSMVLVGIALIGMIVGFAVVFANFNDDPPLTGAIFINIFVLFVAVLLVISILDERTALSSATIHPVRFAVYRERQEPNRAARLTATSLLLVIATLLAGILGAVVTKILD